MIRTTLFTLLVLLPALPLRAEDTAADAEDETAQADETPADTARGTNPDEPKAMSGMSILGNEETPKSLVIIPWKSSELGDELGMSENLDDRAVPVDKEVFMRKLSFYEIRKGE